ncbi:MAG: hypothetical protein PHH47_07885 [Gallionella sp.]|nr:hypothetical protein [Gallionella sp.]MDD4945289.1 hypothetical protein [Gallionella sp.]MDD5612374.1 hypothetical protein [Gallionella sp.]
MKISPFKLVVIAKGIATIAILWALYNYHLISLKTALYLWFAALVLGSLLIYAVKATLDANKKSAVAIKEEQGQ